MATLGTSKWSIQLDFVDTNENRKAKTISGFNLNDDGTAGEDTANANLVYEFASDLIGLTNNTYNGVALIRQRFVE